MGDPITSTLLGGGIIGLKGKEIDEAKAAERDRKRAAEVAAATDKNERTAAIRQQARQERIRRASLQAAAESSGVAGGSAEAGVRGAGQTIAAAGQAFATGQSRAAGVQTDLLARAAKHQSTSAEFGAYFDLAMQGANMAMSAFGGGGGGGK
jgi:hypothetical protein